MDTKKILTADLLDIIFDDRNKEYGAYELRKSYDRRIVKSLIFTGSLLVIAITSFSFINKIKKPKDEHSKYILIAQSIPLVDPTPPVEPIKKIETPKTKTEKFTDKIVIAKPDQPVDPTPTVDELDIAAISDTKTDGPDDQGTVSGPAQNDNRNEIIEPSKNIEPEIYRTVEIEAKYAGDWTKFLTRNLNANVPADNGAPAGRYTVYVQFVVSLDGTISDIKTLTSNGYGMEDEVTRAIKKANKWEPAIQNGRPVKAYRKQAVTFIVEAE